jgi:hypothetical protein
MPTAGLRAFAGRAGIGLGAVLCGAISAAAADPPDFNQDVRPILTARCLRCHGSGKVKGGLDLRTKASVLKGADTGAVLVPGASDKSRLFEVVAQGEMPPKPEPGLDPSQRQVIKAWIDAGAPGVDNARASADAPVARITAEHRRHWSFQTLKRPTVPAVKSPAALRNPVDAFLLAQLQAQGLSLSPEADRATLARRVFLDLLGLPPAPEAVEAFVRDSRPDAYERLVDGLLASPHFGERWGRHWLDEAGYVDVIGTDNDAAIIAFSENKWLYRDYVVRALNEDRPFDRFLTEQIAGDELIDWHSAASFTPEITDSLIATGFLRTAADDTDANELNRADVHHAILQRTGEVLAANLLGVTLNCAKCHDHKYEPITQADYYRFLAILQPAFSPDHWLQPKQRQLPAIAPAQKTALENENARLTQQVEELKSKIADVRKPYERRLRDAKLAAVPEPIRADTRLAIETPAEKRNAIQKYLAEKLEPGLKVSPEAVTAALSPQDRQRSAELSAEAAALEKQRRSWASLQVVYDVAPPTPTRLLKRGEIGNPGPAVTPGTLSVLAASEADSSLAAVKAQGKSSGRRLALARRLTDTRSPVGALVLRVRVNRIWQHLFGKGIVETEDNLGVTGTRPTHPELLEWLAATFDDGGRRLKPFLKLLVTSAAYRQASARLDEVGDATAARIDPDDRLLWRQRLRRLEAEVVRDAVLEIAGVLDRRVGGPPTQVNPKPDGTYEVADRAAGGDRRTLYLLARRNYHPTVLAVFDQPNLTANCTRRTTSAVVLQSLTMLNDRFLLEGSDRVARRVCSESRSPNPEDRVERAFRLILARPPHSDEREWCVALLTRQAERYRAGSENADDAQLRALAHLCQDLLNTSEFLYAP